MSLGVELYNEMLANYQNSLPRKRHLPTPQERMIKIRNSTNYPKKWKISITKEELKNLVWKLPISRTASRYNVEHSTIRYWCIKWKIKFPPYSYWEKKRIAQKNRINKNKEKAKLKQKMVEVKTEKEGSKEKNIERITRTKWSMLKWSENGRTKDEALKNAADILNTIFAYLI